MVVVDYMVLNSNVMPIFLTSESSRKGYLKARGKLIAQNLSDHLHRPCFLAVLSSHPSPSSGISRPRLTLASSLQDKLMMLCPNVNLKFKPLPEAQREATGTWQYQPSKTLISSNIQTPVILLPGFYFNPAS